MATILGLAGISFVVCVVFLLPATLLAYFKWDSYRGLTGRICGRYGHDDSIEYESGNYHCRCGVIWKKRGSK